MSATILDVVEQQLRATQGISDDVRALARTTKWLADAAWNAASAARARMDDLTAERETGRAHAFCEVLGDQAALATHGAFDNHWRPGDKVRRPRNVFESGSPVLTGTVIGVEHTNDGDRVVNVRWTHEDGQPIEPHDGYGYLDHGLSGVD